MNNLDEPIEFTREPLKLVGKVERNWERSRIVEQGIIVGKLEGVKEGLHYMTSRGIPEEVAVRVMKGMTRSTDPR